MFSQGSNPWGPQNAYPDHLHISSLLMSLLRSRGSSVDLWEVAIDAKNEGIRPSSAQGDQYRNVWQAQDANSNF